MREVLNIKKALKDFETSMQKCEDDLNRTLIDIHRGEDPAWDHLWDHSEAYCVLFGAAAAILPVLGLMAWHISRGGTLF